VLKDNLEWCDASDEKGYNFDRNKLLDCGVSKDKQMNNIGNKKLNE